MKSLQVTEKKSMTSEDKDLLSTEQNSTVGRIIKLCLENKLIVLLFTLAIIFYGLLVAPFDWDLYGIQRFPVSVDAIPDIGENQQIVFTQWPGRSPQDIEDQITYPLTVQLLGIPGVKTIRSYSMFGFSNIYVIFKENFDFYWSRTRVLEKINSLPADSLPLSVKPSLGPDATALGQVYWYTIEGLDPEGNPAGGWDLEELRTIQDWYVRYWLSTAEGVAEVASIGGYVREYQVDVDPDAMRSYGVNVDQIYNSIRNANIDVGAKNIEVNKVEYFIRGIGFIKSLEDIENSVITVNSQDIPVLVKHVANVTLGPASRRGALDKEGAQSVGGVVIARYGDNPLKVISNIKKKIKETRHSLPSKAVIDFNKITPAKVIEFASDKGFEAYFEGKLNQHAWKKFLKNTSPEKHPQWIKLSKLSIVPFYDRTGLIYETLGTLNQAISQEIIITIIVILIMVLNFKSCIIISSMLPLAVLLCFTGMKLFGIQANIVALSGIAIAIGTIVDMGIVICENILKHLEKAAPGENLLHVVHKASAEVGSAVLTAVLTTVVSFLPVFTMSGAEGKLFKPLAYTKTFALIASVIIALAVLPPLAHLLFCSRFKTKKSKKSKKNINLKTKTILSIVIIAVLVGMGIYILSQDWQPLGPEKGVIRNLLFLSILMSTLLLFFKMFHHFYSKMLNWCLHNKLIFLSLPSALFFLGLTIWLGFETTFGWLPDFFIKTKTAQYGIHLFPGLGKEFMPNLDEGSFLFMPTTMSHASIGEALDILQKQDMAIKSIPEIDSVVGKLGRAETPLDPAPVSMIETIINYKSEFKTNTQGQRINFKYEKGHFVKNKQGELIPDQSGRPFRQWRNHIKSPNDIWTEILKAAKIPGSTSAPKLQPIAARIVMLQSGMRAPMGIKIKGPTLASIEKLGIKLEKYLKEIPSIETATVIADRIVGKPYLEIIPDRKALARFGIPIKKFQNIIEIAIGGKKVTNILSGRERFPVRVRYSRELRDNIESLEKVLIPGIKGKQIPVTELAEIQYRRGPQVIKSEDTFLIGYVVFDKKADTAEVDVVEQCQTYLQEKITSGELVIPSGVSFAFAGSYENQIRASKTLALVLPMALFIIFMLIYFEFRSVSTTLLIFTGVFIAWSGGFLLIWLYGQPWFLNFEVFEVSMRELFQVHTINLSVAVWVGFLALFGIATDDGVIMGTYLTRLFKENRPETVRQVRDLVITAGSLRVRACLMTTATTILALIPVLTSTGRGSDIMVPMAIPSFGGMLIAVITMLVVPVIFCLIQEIHLKIKN
jgi:Cu(I)/Ag(I) efflux system membrane protein CusA/SilA